MRFLAGALLLAALPAAAQVSDAPAPRPVAETPAPAPGPARPAARPAGAAGDAAAPPSRPQGVSQGRLIPPEEMPAAPPSAQPPVAAGADAAPSPGAPKADAAPSQTPPTADAAPSQGALIPPEPPAPPEPSAPPVPLGPPVPETLRETDFDHAACRLELRRLGAVYREIPAITDPAQRDCGIARPLELTEILPGIALEGGAAMRCDAARALAHWMRDVVVPSAGHLPNSPRLTSLALGTTYHCRGVLGNGTPQNLSEHAVGNAIDIAAFGFDDGSRIEIAPPGDRGDMAVAFQNAVQGAACLFFSTVLGPGSNAAHDDHLHLDIKARRGGFRLCQ